MILTNGDWLHLPKQVFNFEKRFTGWLSSVVMQIVCVKMKRMAAE